MNPSEILQHHQVRNTSARVVLIQTLQNENSPLSEGEIKDLLGSHYDRTTFYRNMLKLTDAGIIHRIVADNVLVKYVLNDCENGHHHRPDHVHFYCQQCKDLICMNEIKAQSYQLPDGFVEQTCDVIIRGVCKKCNT